MPRNIEKWQLALDEVQGRRSQLADIYIRLDEAALAQTHHAAIAQLPQRLPRNFLNHLQSETPIAEVTSLQELALDKPLDTLLCKL